MLPSIHRADSSLPFETISATAQSSNLLEKAAAKFEHLRKHPTSLKPWINMLPKGGELHIHLLGAIYPEELLKIAVKNKLYFNHKTCLFAKTAGWLDWVSASELLTNSEYLINFLNAASMRNVAKEKTNPHDHFMYKCFEVINSIIFNAKPDEIVHLIEIVRINARRQHIRYVELMVGLQTLQQLAKTLSKLNTCDDPKIGYIIEISRVQPNDTFKTQVLDAIQLIHETPIVRAFNIVGPEDHPTSQWNFKDQMSIINQCYQIQPTPIVLHAGELTENFATPLSMDDRIEQSILEGMALRIGHGVCLANSRNFEQLIDLMRKRHIAVEVCLTSNDKILGVVGKQHPVHTYVKEKVKVVVASDDPGVNQEDLNDQFYRMVYEQHFGLEQLIEFTRNSLEFSLLPGESIFEDRDTNKFRDIFIGVDQPDWVPSPRAREIMECSPKAKEQVGHERDLVDYLMKLTKK